MELKAKALRAIDAFSPSVQAALIRKVSNKQTVYIDELSDAELRELIALTEPRSN